MATTRLCDQCHKDITHIHFENKAYLRMDTEQQHGFQFETADLCSWKCIADFALAKSQLGDFK